MNTLFRLDTRFGVLCKEYRPSSDAAFGASDQGRHCLLTEISMKIVSYNENIHQKTPKTRIGLIQIDKDGQVHWRKKA